jgi:hypothetical protein
VEKINERLAVNKQELHKFHMESFNLKLNEVEVKEKYFVDVSNRFAALEDLTLRLKLKLGNNWREYKNFSERGSRLL